MSKFVFYLPKGCFICQRCAFASKSNEFVNYYALLKIRPSATRQEIKDAYIKLSKRVSRIICLLIGQFHPDVDGDEFKKFYEISEAYNILSKPESRLNYDEQFRLHKFGFMIPGFRIDYPLPTKLEGDSLKLYNEEMRE